MWIFVVRRSCTATECLQKVACVAFCNPSIVKLGWTVHQEEAAKKAEDEAAAENEEEPATAETAGD